MKIICIDNELKTDSNSSPEPFFYLKPDSSILSKNSPFFIPFSLNQIQCKAGFVIKINKLGKFIEEKFAFSYYKEIGTGALFTIKNTLEECIKKGLPWERSNAFDGSTVIGHFENISSFNNINDVFFTLCKNGIEVQNSNLSSILLFANKIISSISKFMTLKTGDLIFIVSTTSETVSKNDTLQGFIGYKKSFGFRIK